jgi:hypothetical protein
MALGARGSGFYDPLWKEEFWFLWLDMGEKGEQERGKQ